MTEASVTARAWLVHCCAIGLYAVICVATYVSLWPSHGAPHDGPIVVASVAFLAYALATSAVLQLARNRCGIVYVLHGAGLAALVWALTC